ncbi:trafficking protein particle complex subunit 14 isoform X1 [Myiozetetes cayanensis]|uniref:trafficking protein particle complex subunit 14 isoform X1 n=1 Tax=Myiozetetes cayanensis TaxID=478635 RepID=UPI00215EAEE1|nr:trafficking protein particle complex subunit 14 isoform X1 [Myiozetetes cayanensis]
MESQCDYSMYFPAVPFPPRELLAGSGPGGGYRALPRRNHLYLGETVRFLLVLRCRPGNPAGNPAGNPTGNTAGNAGNTAGNSPPRPPWAQLASSLAALATVAPGGDPAGVPRDGHGDGEDAEPAVFRECRALLTHSKGPPGCPGAGMPVEDPIVATDEVIFPLTVSLDQLPPGTGKAKIVVTVWQRDAEPPELQEGGGYLGLLQGRAPAQVFRQHRGAFKAQVSTMLTVLPPPLVRCRQVTVSGKYLTVLKVLNGCSQEEISLWDVQILPNFNASYLPVMPDGSVLLVDDVCHHSGEVPVGAFCRVAGAGSGCPCALSALEEQNFLFQLQAPERPPEDAKEGLEVPLVAVVQWSTPKLPFTSSIYTHYRLPSIRLERPRFVMTATVESPVPARRRFTVTYTLLNDLQDFLAVRLVWTPETATAGGDTGGARLPPRRAPWTPSCATPPSPTWAIPARAAPGPSVWPSRRSGRGSSSCPST